MKKDILNNININELRVSFIGYGKFAEQLADKMISAGLPAGNITVCGENWKELVERTQAKGIIPCRDVYEAGYYSDIIFLTLPEDEVEDALEDYLELMQEKTVVSVVKGWDFNRYEELFEENTEHISINFANKEDSFVGEIGEKHSLSDENLEKVLATLELLK